MIRIQTNNSDNLTVRDPILKYLKVISSGPETSNATLYPPFNEAVTELSKNLSFFDEIFRSVDKYFFIFQIE